MDALGNLLQVTEPNPQYGQPDSSSTNFQTTYTYDVEGHLTKVQMPRPGGSGTVTQTRTFNYNLTTGLLTSVTNPENGTVSYSYYPSGRVLSKIDAKNQKVVYSYDGYGRVAYIDRYAHATDPYPDPCQSVTLGYDTRTNGTGRLAVAAWGWSTDATYCGGYGIQEYYDYTPGGLLTRKGYMIGVAGYTVPNDPLPGVSSDYLPYTYGPMRPILTTAKGI
jgi:YD repeat-containing protein